MRTGVDWIHLQAIAGFPSMDLTCSLMKWSLILLVFQCLGMAGEAVAEKPLWSSGGLVRGWLFLGHKQLKLGPTCRVLMGVPRQAKGGGRTWRCSQRPVWQCVLMSLQTFFLAGEGNPEGATGTLRPEQAAPM